MAHLETYREQMIGPGMGIPCEVGGRFFSVLAFPGAHEERQRRSAEDAYLALYLRKANEVDESQDPFLNARFNRLVAQPMSWIKAVLRTVRRRLADRQETARLARLWINEMNGFEDQAIPSDMKSLSQRQVALHLCGGDEDRADRFLKRVVRPSRPIFHLALAIQEEVYSLDFEREVPANMEDVALFRRLVERASYFQPLIAADRRFNIRREDQLTLRWAA